METGVGELDLRLHPHRSENGQVRRGPDEVLEQGRLPDPSLTAHHQRPALSLADRVDQSVEQRALAGPAAQGRFPPCCGAASHGPRVILKQTTSLKTTLADPSRAGARAKLLRRGAARAAGGVSRSRSSNLNESSAHRDGRLSAGWSSATALGRRSSKLSSRSGRLEGPIGYPNVTRAPGRLAQGSDLERCGVSRLRSRAGRL